MSDTITITPGETVEQDPSSFRIYKFSWDSLLAAGVQVTASSQVIIAAIDPVTAPLMTQDNFSILSGNRKTQVRLSGGALAATYRITGRIVTNETPSQTEDRSFYILIKEQ